jgi:hypothetical protein
MKKINLLISSLALSTVMLAQNNKENTAVVYYPFDGVKSLNEIKQLDIDIKKIINVTDSKTEYKEGKSQAQLRVWVKSNPNAKESDKIFTPALLKQMLVEKGYMPHQPTIIDASKIETTIVNKK